MVEASPCGCEAAAPSCGCEAAPAVETSLSAFEASPAMVPPFAGGAAPSKEHGCGCSGGFLSHLRTMGKCGSTAEASSCGCDAAPAAPAASSCGCDAAPAVSSCGCNAAPVVSSCGCDAGPAVSSCGCNAGPAAVSPCGHGAPLGANCKSGGGGLGSYAPGGTRPRLSLLDRLKGNRTARDRDGKVLGVCNDGCNPSCPGEAHGSSTCGQTPCSSCSTCGGGEVIYSDAMPVSGCANGSCGSTPTYGAATALPAAAASGGSGSRASGGSGSRVEPAVPTAPEGTLQETERRDITQPNVIDVDADPVVDPGAFVPRVKNAMDI